MPRRFGLLGHGVVGSLLARLLREHRGGGDCLTMCCSIANPIRSRCARRFWQAAPVRPRSKKPFVRVSSSLRWQLRRPAVMPRSRRAGICAPGRLTATLPPRHRRSRREIAGIIAVDRRAVRRGRDSGRGRRVRALVRRFCWAARRRRTRRTCCESTVCERASTRSRSAGVGIQNDPQRVLRKVWRRC